MLKICLFFTASNSAQKNFLYENLGMYTQSLYKKYKTNVLFLSLILESLGLLTETLKMKLKICSEISLIR
jgi:hypothetical protein